MVALTFEGARVLRDGGWNDAPLALTEGLISDAHEGRRVDLSGYDILPGIVDPHGDGFERHMAPRRGALPQIGMGVVSCAAELAANGITTAMLAQFWSWEGGMRGPDFAKQVFAAVHDVAPTVPIDLRMQMRLETHLVDEFPEAEVALERWGIGYVVFNDHLPHDRLAAGRKPPRLTGQALKSGRSPERHLALMQELHARSGDVPEALDALSERLVKRGVRLGSHDDQTAGDRETWRKRGARISEFPETLDAAEAARLGGDAVIMGAPNIVRGASHAGKVAAAEIVAAGLCDALASDYHYPSPARAALRCVELGLCDMATAWRMVSDGPAQMLGLSDRGRLAPGLRADLLVMSPEDGRIVATIAGGQIAWLSGDVAERFF